MCFLIEMVELNIFLLQVINFPNNLFFFIQLMGQVLVFMLDPIQLSFDHDQIFVTILQKKLHYF
jgi:hypothetical protein